MDNGTYEVSYEVQEACKVEITILFEDDKQNMVPIRGSPYRAGFIEGQKAADNIMVGGAMERHIKKEMERLTSDLSNLKKETVTKEKDLKNVKVLLGIQDSVK